MWGSNHGYVEVVKFFSWFYFVSGKAIMELEGELGGRENIFIHGEGHICFLNKRVK